MIQIENLSFSYNGIHALSDVSLGIGEGESVALMGTSGCGKSTLLKIINGIIFPQRGTYRFDGNDITAKRLSDPVTAKTFHRRIGFVFQNSDVQLFCSSVYDEIAFGLRQTGMSEKEIAGRVNDCLSLLEIEHLSERQPYHLSGGEKRKTAIAAVLALNPDVLTLDEPLNGLDPRTQRWVVDLVMKLNRAGKTVITSTHSLELVQELSARAVLFDATHSIAADMPTGRLLENVDLLKEVNLVDESYHRHEGSDHYHFHSHPHEK